MEESRATRRRVKRLWFLSGCVIAILVLAVSVVASSHQRHQLTFDVFDEGQHYDYVVALTHGHIPRSGEKFSQETMRAISCLGDVGWPPTGCQVKHRNPDGTMPVDGYNYEALTQPPLAYIPYVITADPGAAPATALLDARWGGLIWNVIGGVLVIAVGWLAELSLFELGTVLVICLLSPVQIHAISTVTDDSSGVAAGALVLGTFLLAKRRQKPMVVLGLTVGLVVGFMKGLFVLAPLVVLLGLLFGDIAERRRPNRDELWSRYGCSTAMLVGAIASYVGWVLIVDARATVPLSVVEHAVESFTVVPHLRPSTMLTGFTNELALLNPYAPAPLYWIWNLIVFGSLGGLIVLKGPPADSRMRALASAIFVGMIALAVFFPLLNFVQGHYNIAAPARFALSLLPIVGFVVARASRLRGLLLIGLLLPGLALVAQLVGGQF
jgi:hypothetical protein